MDCFGCMSLSFVDFGTVMPVEGGTANFDLYQSDLVAFSILKYHNLLENYLGIEVYLCYLCGIRR